MTASGERYRGAKRGLSSSARIFFRAFLLQELTTMPGIIPLRLCA